MLIQSQMTYDPRRAQTDFGAGSLQNQSCILLTVVLAGGFGGQGADDFETG
jgi:hypothetical protein